MDQLANSNTTSFLPILVFVILGLFTFVFLQLSTPPNVGGLFGPPRPNTRKYICLSRVSRKKGAFEWLFGPPDVLKTLASLPEELEELDVSFCDEVVEIQSLPPNLKIFRAKFCKNLRRIGSLPESLEVMDVWGCENYENFPAELPGKLKVLKAAGVPVKRLPAALPPALEELDMRNCEQLEAGPTAYPDTLVWINFCGTKLKGKVVAPLPPRLDLSALNDEGYTGYRWSNKRLSRPKTGVVY
jgi:hypothetical protein